MTQPELPRVLLVDDEPDVVAGIATHLRLRASVQTATSAKQALTLLESDGPFAVLVTDLRMPGMDGLALLNAVYERWPDTVRVLLTGQADTQSAAAAVNSGQIFRFLLKPCPPPELIGAVRAAAEQHRLITAERVLLQQTLLGAVKALTDVLALANPMAFGRADRIRRRVSELAAHLEMPDRWTAEIAAMLTQVAMVTLPPTTIDKLYYGFDLEQDEQQMVGRMPEVVENLLRHLPRLEAVREIIGAQQMSFVGKGAGPAGDAIPLGARILKVATDLDALEAREDAPADPVSVLRRRVGEYDPRVLDALASVLRPATPVQSISLAALTEGMRLAEDILTPQDIILVPRGFQVDLTLLERLRNLPAGAVSQPIVVYRED
jgi:response regulator RpfG family c-di-GMP phosphodiesterase